MTAAARTCLLLLPIAVACAGPGLPDGFAAAAAQAPEAMPARLVFANDQIIAAAAGLGTGGLPAAVRAAVAGIAPDGELLFQGREWGPAGSGFRIDKRYLDGAEESFRSMLVGADGAVLERSHSVPIAKVPPAILTTALAIGRDLRRCEIVADGAREIGWRITLVDGDGRTMVVATGLDGVLRTRHRLVAAQATFTVSQ